MRLLLSSLVILNLATACHSANPTNDLSGNDEVKTKPVKLEAEDAKVVYVKLEKLLDAADQAPVRKRDSIDIEVFQIIRKIKCLSFEAAFNRPWDCEIITDGGDIDIAQSASKLIGAAVAKAKLVIDQDMMDYPNAKDAENKTNGTKVGVMHTFVADLVCEETLGAAARSYTCTLGVHPQ